MSPRILAAGGALLIVARRAGGGRRRCPTIQPLKPCYVTAGTAAGAAERGRRRSRAAGFTPNSKVDLTIDGAPFEGSHGLQTDAAGSARRCRTSVPAPFVARGQPRRSRSR